MPWQRGKDGSTPEYVPTERVPSAPGKTPAAPTSPPPPTARPPGSNPADAVPPTVRSAPPTEPSDHRGRDAGGDGRTRVYRPDRSPTPDAKAPAPPADRGLAAAEDAMADPPAGWLVIVDGPGKGRVVALGLHHNPIGRDPRNRVVLDYGDETISRSRHLVVTYDPEGRRFYVTPGDGTNLCYVNDQPVLASMPLEPFAHVRTGRTTLRFVPLCGPDFSWDGADPAAADRDA